MMNEVENELVKAAVDVAKDVAADIVRPTSKSIGTNLGLLVDGAIGWLGCWGEKQIIKQQHYIEEFKKSVSNEISAIEPEHLCEPKISAVGPAIEASKYFYEEKYYREMFSKLIAASCNTKTQASVHPAFVEVIKQLSPLDAKLLGMFKYKETYPCIDVVEKRSNGKLTPFTKCLFDFHQHSNDFSIIEFMNLTAALDNLIRLGVVNKNNQILEDNYDYDLFCRSTTFMTYEKLMQDGSKIGMNKYRIELTEFGRAFTRCCF